MVNNSKDPEIRIEEIRFIAKQIKVFFCDSDGVMFPNTVLMGAPYRAKLRSYYDGQGISLLRAIGIRVVFITNEKGESTQVLRDTVEKLNSLASSKPQKADGWEPIMLYEGRGGTHKLDTAKEYLEGYPGVTLEQCAFMGDDLVDAPLLKAVGLSAAPYSAEKIIKDTVMFVTERNGGEGAIRDFANMIMQSRNIDPFDLPPQ